MRSASALAAGTVREVAAVALPIGFRRGRLYRSLVDVTLQFLIEDVGGVQAAQPNEQKLGEDFLLRRAAGNGIELMGVIAFRASPVWVLAALADVAGFGRQLIPEIAESLKKEGLLAPDGSFATMEQLLGGLERSSGQLAESVNAPPLDVAGLREEWRKFAAEARQLPAPQLPSASAVTRIWQDLRATAERERRSVFAVSSLLAVCRRQRAAGAGTRPVEDGGGRAASRRRRRIERAARALSAVAAANARGRVPALRRAAAHAVHACRHRRVRPARETLTGKLLDRF